MGIVISKAANGFGALVGSAFLAPFKSVFGGSCEGICSGTWDITCFIEHLCVSNLVKLLMVLGLSYATLMIFYLLFKLGVVQCIGKNLCKMCWAACEGYWYAVHDITCFLWHKLRNTKRVYRGRRVRDVEQGYSSTKDEDFSIGKYESFGMNMNSKRRSIRGRRDDRMRKSLYPVRMRSKYHYRNRNHHHDVRWKTSEVSVRVKGGSGRLRNSRQIQVRKTGHFGREVKLFKRKKIR